MYGALPPKVQSQFGIPRYISTIIFYLTPLQTLQNVSKLIGHKDAVNTLVPVTNHSYDDYPSFICSASNDSTIRIWATQTLESVAALKGHRNWIRALISVRYISENTVTVKLWSGSDDTTIKIWDIYQPNVKIATLKPKSIQMNCGIFCLAQIDDQIWAGAADKSIKILDIQSEQVVRVIPAAHNGGISIITRVGDFVFTGSMDRSLRTWTKVIKNKERRTYVVIATKGTS